MEGLSEKSVPVRMPDWDAGEFPAPNNWSCTSGLPGRSARSISSRSLASEYAKNHFGWIQMTWMCRLTKQDVPVRADPIARYLFEG